MRTIQLLLRAGPTVAAAAALPLALAAPSVSAQGSGISVSTTGSSVSVTTSACPTATADGSFGRASLLSSGQANFAQGRQATLTGTSATQSAAWANVSPGTYTVIVICGSNQQTAGTQSIVVSATPTISATASPSLGVIGGVGGAAKEYGTLTLVGGGALVAVGAGATVWFLRRRAKPHRL
ncbi:hypothetical protein [Streptomyces sp. NPDC002845]